MIASLARPGNHISMSSISVSGCWMTYCQLSCSLLLELSGLSTAMFLPHVCDLVQDSNPSAVLRPERAILNSNPLFLAEMPIQEPVQRAMNFRAKPALVLFLTLQIG